MARIISYPPLENPTNSDLLIVSDVSAANTKSLTIEKLSTHVIVTNDIVKGTGTNNYVTQWVDAPNRQIGDSPAFTFDGGAGLKQFILTDGYRFVVDRDAATTLGDPEYAITQNGVSKTSFGWDDDGGGFGFLYNWAGKGFKFGSGVLYPQFELLTDPSPLNISFCDLQLDVNGAGPSTGSKSLVFRGIDDLGTQLDGAKIFTRDSNINPRGQDLVLQTADDNGNLATGLFIDAFQQIAIAKNTAQYQLDVGGTLNIDGIAVFQNRLGVQNATNQNQGIRFTHPAGGASGVVNMYYAGAAAGSRFTISRAATGGAEIELESDGDVNINRTGNGNFFVGGEVTFDDYGSGTKTGTATYNLAVDASGKVIEEVGGSGVTGTGTTDYFVKFIDGPNGVIGDVPNVLEQAGEVLFQADVRFDAGVQFDGGAVGSFQNLEMLDGSVIKFMDSAGPVDVEINSVVGSNTLSISNNVSLPTDKKLNFGPSAYIEGTVAGTKIIVRASDDILFQPGNTQHVEFVSTGGVNLNSLGSYADDAAAGAAGVPQNGLYQTDGTGVAPLNVAGIVMIKQ